MATQLLTKIRLMVTQLLTKNQITGNTVIDNQSNGNTVIDKESD